MEIVDPFEHKKTMRPEMERTSPRPFTLLW